MPASSVPRDFVSTNATDVADGSLVPSTSTGSRRGVIDTDDGVAQGFHPDNPDTELDEGLDATKSLHPSRS